MTEKSAVISSTDMNNISQEHSSSLFSNILLFLETQCQILIAERSTTVKFWFLVS